MTAKQLELSFVVEIVRITLPAQDITLSMLASSIPKSALLSLRDRGLSLREMAAELSCSTATLQKACKLNEVSLARSKKVKHCAHCGGVKAGPVGLYCSVACHQAHLFAELFARFTRNEQVAGSPKLFRRLVLHRDGHICSKCQNTEWQGSEIPLELEHIDGDSENNLACNLKMLCPNCHAQTLTYKSKNKGRGRHARRERYAKGLSY